MTTQLCGAIMMVALAAFCLCASKWLSESHVGWVVRTFRWMGIPAERRFEAWFIVGAIHGGWAVICLYMALVAGRAVKRQNRSALVVVAVCHCVSTVVVGGWGIAMANFVRVPLLLVACLWVWTIWGYFALAHSWRGEQGP